MREDRDRALTLAHEAESKNGSASPEAVIARARIYLDFLCGTRDADVLSAAHHLAKIIEVAST